MFNSDFTPVSYPLGSVHFDYSVERIKTLLNRSGRFGEAAGILFHFNRPRPENPTDLYAISFDMFGSINDSDETTQDDYFKSDGTAVRASRAPDIVTSLERPGPGTSVKFTREILETYTANPDLVAVRMLVVGYGAEEDGFAPYMSLVSCGVNAEGRAVQPFLLSGLPCPPKCPVDTGSGIYGSGY